MIFIKPKLEGKNDMSHRAYIACSYQDRKLYQPLSEAIKTSLSEKGWRVSIPVFELSNISVGDYGKIMDESFKLLKESSLLIVEASEKNIGIGIETGYAKALNIPIIYLRKETASLSTTLKGTATYSVVYSSVKNVVDKILSIVEADF